jgi:uncharacterized protein with HEPN domain
MRPEERDAAYLWDMLESARAVLRYTGGITRERFDADRILQRAVEREVEIIGEAASRISEPLRTAHPEVPWRLVIAQRNFLIHDYGDIDNERIWLLIVEHIPQFVRLIEPLVPKLPE